MGAFTNTASSKKFFAVLFFKKATAFLNPSQPIAE
jgi:hypothetical protein